MSDFSAVLKKAGIPEVHITIGSIAKTLPLAPIIDGFKANLEGKITAEGAVLSGPIGAGYAEKVLAKLNLSGVIPVATVQAILAEGVTELEGVLIAEVEALAAEAEGATATPTPAAA